MVCINMGFYLPTSGIPDMMNTSKTKTQLVFNSKIRTVTWEIENVKNSPHTERQSSLPDRIAVRTQNSCRCLS